MLKKFREPTLSCCGVRWKVGGYVVIGFLGAFFNVFL